MHLVCAHTHTHTQHEGYFISHGNIYNNQNLINMPESLYIWVHLHITMSPNAV